MEEKKVYCKNCGQLMENDDKFCGKCGMYLNENKVDKDKDNAIGILLGFAFCVLIGIILLYVPVIIGIRNPGIYSICSLISTVLFIGAILLIVIGKIKYGSNKIICLIFWINIAIIATILLTGIIIIARCMFSCLS